MPAQVRQPLAAAILLSSIFSMGCGWNPLGSKQEYVRRGNQFAQQGKFSDAAIQYQKAIQKDAKYGEAYLRYGQLEARQKRNSDAFKHFARAVDLLPQSMEAKAELGSAAVSELLRDPHRPVLLHRTASNMAGALLAADPHSASGLRIMGYLALADADPQKAIDFFKKTLAADPNLPEIDTILAQTLIQTGRGDEAETVAKSGVDRFKTYAPLYDILYSRYIATNRVAEAETLLRAQIAASPKNATFVIELADHFRRRKNTAEMNRILGELQSNRSYPDVALQVGDYYRSLGDYDAAVRAYQSDPSANQKKVYLERLASVGLTQGRIEEAASVLDNLLKIDPNDQSALASRADLRMSSANPAEQRKGLEELQGLAKKDPKNVQVGYSLGRAYRQMGNDSSAQQAFLQVLQQAPRNQGALRELADISIRAGHADEALRYSERLIEIDPNNVGARLVRTSAWAITGRYAEVRAELRKILDAKPDLTEAWLQLGTLDLDTKNYPEAEQAFRRIYQSGKGDLRSAKGLTMLYFAQLQPQKALAVAKEASGHWDNAQARKLLAVTAAEAGNPDLALTTAQALASKFPDDAEAPFLLGEIYQEQGRLDMAIISYRTARSKAPEREGYGIRLASALAEAGQFDEAIEICRSTLKLRPKDPALMNRLAWYLALAGKNLSEAETLSRDAVLADQKNTAFADTEALVYLKSGRFQDAVQILQPLVHREPGNTAFHLHLASALIGIGQRAQARQELGAASKTNPTRSESGEIRKLLQSAS